MWSHDVSDMKEVERMLSLYNDDCERIAGTYPYAVSETDCLVRSCDSETGAAVWDAYSFASDTWTVESFSNREAAELWISEPWLFDQSDLLNICVDFDHRLTESLKRMAELAVNMSGGRWTAGIQEYKDGSKSLSFQLSSDGGFFLITSPIGNASELALGKVRDRVCEVLEDLDPYREALEACRRAEDSSIALDKLAFYEKLKNEDMPVLLGALSVATEQNQRALGRMLADAKFTDMYKELPKSLGLMDAAFAEAKGKLREWKESGRTSCYFGTAISYLDSYYDIGDDINLSLVCDIDELIEYGYLDESGVYENPVAVIGTMLAEAAFEHARADAEYFDEDFRMRATEGFGMWTVAREIVKTVPEAKPAEEEPTQARGPKL